MSVDMNFSMEKHAIFPRFAATKKEPSTIITDILKDIAPKVAGMHKDPTSHGLRLGSFNLIVNHRDCELSHGIIRGGWSFEHLCNAFQYLLQSNHSLCIGGAALSGWSNCRTKIFQPRLKPIFDMYADNPTMIDVIYSFMVTLYNYPYK